MAPDVRNRLDELKRIELDRLRKLAMREHQLEVEMAREQHGGDGNDLDGRRWRTVLGGHNNINKNIPANLLGPYSLTSLNFRSCLFAFLFVSFLYINFSLFFSSLSAFFYCACGMECF